MVLGKDKKTWRDQFIDIYEDIPESDGFNPDIADKQIEGLFNLVVIMGEQLTIYENAVNRLVKLLYDNKLNKIEEFKYSQEDSRPANKSMYL